MTVPQTTVRVSGPLFDGRALAALDDFVDAAVEDVAQQGVNDVRTALDGFLRNPTGFYSSRIQTERQRDSAIVNDSGVIYGPWLAGVGSRNATSVFKGYPHWRLATQRLDSRAEQIAQRTLPPFLRRMN